ncbi:MAG: SDR family NAD(P)-dependent oxidoreductase [Tepidiformaceae bacterium]
METFRDRVAVVTGGASGIGLALAHRFADEGMKVVIGDIEAEPLAMAEAALGAKSPVLAQRVDVSQPEQLEALAEAAYRRFGAVHILCNNAGVGGSPGASWELSLDDWRWVIDVDLWSVVHGIRAFIPRMIAAGEEGHIVNTASVAGLLSGAVGTPYTVAKFGVVALSESLHYELERVNAKLGVSVLCPGFVNTNIYDSARNRQAGYGEASLQPTPEGEQMRVALDEFRPAMAQPDEVAAQVFEAIRERSLYVVPAPDNLRAAVSKRHANIDTLKNPEGPPALF